jgi:hypothetical protein
MKLDFSVLAQPAGKARGQVGTTGTRVFTRVCAYPLTRPGAGTAGDKPAAVALASGLVVAIPAACPPVSPDCPQAAAPEKLNAGTVSPVSPLGPTETAQVAATAPCDRETLADEPTGAGVNTCTDCLHLLRRGTCGSPVAAGLLTAEEGFGIVWPTPTHAATCVAYSGKTTTKPIERPYRRAQAQGDCTRTSVG